MNYCLNREYFLAESKNLVKADKFEMCHSY